MRNVYIERDANNNIIGRYSRPQYDGQEFLPRNDQELIDLDTEEQVIIDAKQTRLDDIETEKENSGLKDITIQQALDWIDAQFENVSTIAQTRTATVNVLKRMVPYILD